MWPPYHLSPPLPLPCPAPCGHQSRSRPFACKDIPSLACSQLGKASKHEKKKKKDPSNRHLCTSPLCVRQVHVLLDVFWVFSKISTLQRESEVSKVPAPQPSAPPSWGVSFCPCLYFLSPFLFFFSTPVLFLHLFFSLNIYE